MASLEELLKKAQALNDEKKHDEVIELLTEPLLEKYKSDELYAEKAQAYFRLQKKELCNEAVEKALIINPKNAKANHYKANIYSDFKEYDKAIESYKKAIEADPKYAYPYYGLGQVYDKLKEYNKAIEFYKKSIEIDPNDSDGYYVLGHVYYDLKEYNKAIEFYKKSIEIDPNDADSYNSLGNIYSNLNQNDKSIEFYEKAIEIDPKHAHSYNGLGNVYSKLKEYDKSTESYKKAIETDPKDSYPYNGLGNVYNELKNYNKAKESYEKAIEADPKDAYPYNGMGIVYYNLKEYDKSIEFYKKSIDADPEYAAPYYNRALSNYNIEEYKKSLADYDKYVKLTKDSPDYYTSIAKSRTSELKKLIENKEYSSISELVNKIKTLLLFKEECVTHYTSLSVAKALILDGSLFRLSEGAFLNDTSEGREIFRFLSFHITTRISNETIAELFAQKPFIGSFVTETKHDDLTLWRMYGKEEKEEARGCAITMEVTNLLERIKDKLMPDRKTGTSSKTDEEFKFYKVAYKRLDNSFILPGSTEKEQEEFNNHMNELLDKIKTFNRKRKKNTIDIQNLQELLNEIAYLFKSAEYQHEDEVRLVVKGIGMEKNINPNPLTPRVYVELVSIKPLIRKITLGPKVERADEWAAAFYYSLDKDNFHPKIFISHLPFK